MFRPGTVNRNSGAGRAGSLIRRLATVLAVTAAIAAVGCGGGNGVREGEQLELVIPAGTSRSIDAGKPVSGIPDRIEARVGDTLVVRNLDRETQFVSGFAVSPGQTMEIPLLREGTYMTDCSAHEDKAIEMVVEA